MLKKSVRKIVWIIIGIWLCGLLSAANAAATGNDEDGSERYCCFINDDGVVFDTGDGKYSDRILWTKFSQDALKLLANDPNLVKKHRGYTDFARTVH